MLFPLTHEHASSRRWPFVTATIILACLGALIATEVAMQSVRREVEAAAERAIAFYEAHPYLEPTPPLDRVVDAPSRRAAPPHARPQDPRTALFPDLHAKHADPTADQIRVEQAQLDALCADVTSALDDSPLRRFGYIPKQGNALGLLTSQFMHAGWMHLLFNMWFLWLCGCNLEDKWGRAVFVPFYLSAGVVSALVHHLASPMSDVPLVGASGAIAGAMGAFLVSFTKTKIRFFWFYGFRWGTFDAAAYIMLPLWLAEQLVYGLVATSSGGDGVAYWAHVGGFVYGVAFAGVLKATGLEKKLDDAVEAAVTISADPRLVRAGELIDTGGSPAAIAMLEKLSTEQPASIDVQLELLRGAKVMGDTHREVRAYAKAMTLYMNAGVPQTASDLYNEARAINLHEKIPATVRVRLAEHMASTGQHGHALLIFESVVNAGLVDATTVRAAVLAGQLASAAGRRDDARALLEAARESPFSTPELDTAIDRALAELAPA